MTQTGGQWERAAKVWKLRYDQVKKLGLEDRVVSGPK